MGRDAVAQDRARPTRASAGVTFDVTQIDEVLATTRAVRRRLDLERPVDNQLLLDCIDLAEQAPTGGNLGSRRWVIVREQRVKDQLGQLYSETALPFMSAAAERLLGTGHPSEKVMASAAYLAEHLAEVPAIVIPTVIGHHDGSGRPGLFDSVIQAAWSFCLALRARGLGTTWVTAALQDTAKVKEILRIPEDMTEIALLPVAYTKGTDFRRAPRHPARSITYFDRFGTDGRARPERRAALRRRSRRHRRGRHRRLARHGVVAGVGHQSPSTVLQRVRRRRVGERQPRRRRHVPRAQPARRARGVDDPVLHRHLRRTSRLRLAHLRSRQPRARVGVSISNPEKAAPACGSPTSWDPDRPARPWRSPTTPARKSRVLRRRIGEVQANMQRTVEGVKQLAEATR